MKKNALFVLIGSLLALAVFSVRAQTDTNVDFLTLNFNISLTAYTNGIAETNGNLATATPGRVRITTKDVIQALSNHVVFPILTRTNPNGVAVPYDGPAVMTNFSRTAKLVILQGLGTNHGVFYIAIRDGRPAVDYDASDYFDFTRRGFRPATGDTITTEHVNLDDGADTSSEMYLGEFAFDNSAFAGGVRDKTAFTVDGVTTTHKTAVKEKGEILDPSVMRSLNATVAGTGMLGSIDLFSVLKGSIHAGAARHETK